MEIHTRILDFLRARWVWALVLVGAILVPLPGPVAASKPMTAHEMLERVIEQNPTLASYKSRVHVEVHMLNFPYLSPKLDGTSYFKRPNNYEVVFDRVPGYAKGFSKIFTDAGDPSSWERDQNVGFEGRGAFNGRDMFVLRMTKKIHSDILAYTLAYIDPKDYTVQGMEWHYTNGGVITMTQNYRTEGPFMLISSQHITVNIPHVRAVGDASYGIYQTNVALDEGVFTK